MLLKRAIVVTALLTIACALLIPTLSAAQTPSPTSSLLVKLVDGLSVQEQADVIARNGGVEISSIPALRLHVIQVAPADLPQVLANYQADPQVVNAEENKTRQSQAFPTDPLYPNQWALAKIGWDQVFGAVMPTGSAIVAILDTGVDAQHPDLAGNVIPGTSILDGSAGTTDPSGHGTWVAGIAAAQTNTTPVEGIAGVAYAGVRIMPVTVLDVNGLGQDSDVIAGVIWAADHGADVIVMAFSNPGFSHNLQDAIDYAWSKNVVLVAATGNDGVSTPTFPAGDRGVMGVSATDPNDSLVPFSNSGPSVFIAAPGTDIQTTTIGDAYTVISGTSASAAIVAGAAAFMRAVDPTLTNGVIVGRLARMADPAGTQDQTGNGRINMARALADTGIDFIQPAGAAPVGAGGPFVGPYVAAAACNSLAFTTAAQTILTGQLSVVITVEAQRSGNNNCSISGTTVSLSSNSTGTATFYDAAGANTVTTVTLTNTSTNGPHTASFLYKDTKEGTPTITAASTGLTSAIQQETVKIGTSTALTSNPNPSTVGAAVTFTATVTRTDGMNPNKVTDGSVTLKEGATVLGGPTPLDNSGKATFPVTFSTAGTHTIKADYGGTGSPTFFAVSTSPNLIQNVNAQAASTTTFGTAPTPTYLGGNFIVSATNDSGGTITYSRVSGPCALVSGATFSSSGAGSCVVKADSAATTNYLASSAQQTVTIAQAASTTTFGTAPTPTYLGGNFIVSATNDSGGAITYSRVSGPCALVSGATFSSSGAGSCVVQADSAATTNYLASSAQQTVTIAKAQPTVTFGAAPTPTYLGGNFTVSATTTNTDSAGLTYSVVSGPCALVSGATFSSSGAGTCKVQASGAVTTNYLAASAQQDVTIAKAPTTTAVSAPGAVQYSDKVNLSATVSAASLSGLTGSVEFFMNGTSQGSSPINTSGVATLSPQVLLGASASNYPVSAKFTSTSTNFQDSPVSATQSLTVTTEDATVTYGAGNPEAAPVLSPGGSSGPFSISVAVAETSPEPNGGGLAMPGDINKADVSITLTPVGPGAPPTPTSCTSSVSSSTKTFTCNFNAVAVNTYSVVASVTGNYYKGFWEDVVTVYDPSLGFTTGGGTIAWPGTGDKTNFGYTMKYNKNLTNVQGSLLLIRHLPDGSIYRVKSNSVGGLSIGQGQDPNVPTGWASFTGKATYLQPGWADPVGNYSFIVYVEDRNQPGTGFDRFWLQVKDGGGSLVGALSISPDGPTNAQGLTGGNIVVPHTR